MARYLTSKTLIDSVIRRAMLPLNQNTFSEADLLAFANEEMDMGIIPYIMTFHEDYFMRSDETLLQAGRSTYPIPYRAMGNKLRDVAFRDGSSTIFEMTRVGVGDLPFYQFGGGGNVNGAGIRTFYIKNNEVCLLPEDMPDVHGWLRMSYYIRPNSLVSLSRIGTITNVDTTTGVITLDSIPTNFALSAQFDMLQTKSPHKCLAIDKTALAIDTVAKTITFDVADMPYDIAAGDYISLAEECIIPQIPSDIHSMLAQRVACRCLEALGDVAGLQAANAKLQEMEQKGGSLLDDRVEDAPQKINNRHSFLKRYRTYFKR